MGVSIGNSTTLSIKSRVIYSNIPIFNFNYLDTFQALLIYFEIII